MIYAEIELLNASDVYQARKNLIDHDEVKRIRVNMLVDTGSYVLAINQTIQEVLQLPLITHQRVWLASNKTEEHDLVGPIEIRYQDKTTSCNAIVLPGDCEPLLGAVPMEAMEVLVDPLRQELIVNPEIRRGRYF